MTTRKILIVLAGVAALGIAVFEGTRLWEYVRQKRMESRSAKLFEREVKPLLSSRCIRCHGSEKQEGDLRLDTLANVLLGGKSGPALIPGDTRNSLLLTRVHHKNPRKMMPPRNRLNDKKLHALTEWVAGGAAWKGTVHAKERPSSSPAALAAEKHGDAWRDPANPIAKLFGGKRLDLWSLQPLQNPRPPAVRDTSWPRNPIDSFVLAKMEAAGAQPAPEAGRRILARRLYLSMTGLPPTPEQMDAFLMDASPDAYQALIDKLLSSREYGEHWARFWLDVIRYSDSNGFDYDEFRPQAWRFRDYVVRSLNADKPFNTFIREHLAGDEMVPGLPQTTEDQDRLIATGYLRVGPYDNSAQLFGERDRCHAQVMSDLVETTGSAFLGVTFNCCRCHDHKTDPLSQADYYRFRAFFENMVPADETILDLPPRQQTVVRETAAINAVKEELAELRESVRDRVYHERITTLPAKEQEFLKKKPDTLTKEEQIAQRIIREKIEVGNTELEASFNEEDNVKKEEINKRLAELEAKRQPPTSAFIAVDAGRWPSPTYILSKGDYLQPAAHVEAGIPSVFNPNPLPPAETARKRSTGRRTALAQWITAPSNPLTARVLVNRIWQQHFGSGLVATPNDFGYTGAPPTHPELLDWLARRFMADGWSLKKLHRLMLNSAAWRQGIVTDGEPVPPGLFVGQPPRRLTGEALRDAMLKVSGLLRPHAGGPPLWPELPPDIISSNPGILVENMEKTRGWYPSPHELTFVRSLYLVQKRSLRLPFMETFDQPENTLSCGRRMVSTVPTQALSLLNSPFAAETSEAFAQLIQREAGADPTAQIERIFALAFQRSPAAEEKTDCALLLQEQGLPALCRAVLNTNEFAYVD